jgi:exosortase/archaeosortase family protein
MADEQQENKRGAKTPAQHSRRNTVSFITIFVVVVLLLLTGYRYAIDTVVNDWYLFQVARHTSWVLNHVGNRSELEGTPPRIEPAELRAQLNAWRQGREEADPAEIAQASTAPLTPWEQWSYRAAQARRGDHKGSVGPRVSFILRAGLNERLNEIRKRVQELESGTDGDVLDRSSQLEAAQRTLDTLLEEQREQAQKPELRRRNKGYSFNFIVIPECGAIEVMAIFLAAVLAFPTRWWKRLFGIALGVPIMYGVNIFRLSCLGVIGSLDNGGKWFSFSHHYVWQAIYIVFVVAVWLAWIELFVHRKSWVESALGALFSKQRIRTVAAFCLKFIVFVTVLTVFWWLLLPYYGYVLIQLTGGTLKYLLGVPLEAGYIQAQGMLNTESTLVFHIPPYAPTMPIALLITNLPPYVALVLATAGLAIWKRIRILAYGSGILAFGHALFIVLLAMIFLEAQKPGGEETFIGSLATAKELPTAIIQFYLTMPFLLWIVFAYWDRLMGYLREEEETAENAPEPTETPPETPDSAQ